MAARTYSTHGRIAVTIEIINDSPYGPEWTVEDVRKQVTEEAMARLERIVRVNVGVRIVGTPVFTLVTMTEKTS